MPTPLAQVTVEGLAETELKLHQLGEIQIPRAIGKALQAGGRILTDAIRAEAVASIHGQSKTDPGGLIRGIRMATVTEVGNEHVVAGPIWATGTHHRHLVIEGHNIQSRHGGPILGRARSNDFVDRARDAAAEAALQATQNALAAEIAEATAR